ncbi:hypothetical protein IMZ48_00600 [Candidatus Bathyarchaeota archaeon]|nr:hypothetical protein [Candidatus Bathyarchaeota archaeon]
MTSSWRRGVPALKEVHLGGYSYSESPHPPSVELVPVTSSFLAFRR